MLQVNKKMSSTVGISAGICSAYTPYLCELFFHVDNAQQLALAAAVGSGVGFYFGGSWATTEHINITVPTIIGSDMLLCAAAVYYKMPASVNLMMMFINAGMILGGSIFGSLVLGGGGFSKRL